MPALNFSVFIDKVESGEKRCTIRKKRKRPIKEGDILHLYTGMRHKGARKLMEVTCLSVTPIVIDGDRVRLGDDDLFADEIVALARRDGFATAADFFSYFGNQWRFEGDLIEW